VDINFEKRSGNHYLDDSAMRAIKKANPLPPLPDVFRDEYLEIGIRFLPSDLG
jgi:colicin import membrane protein